MHKTFTLGPRARARLAEIVKNEPELMGAFQAFLQGLKEGSINVPTDCKPHAVAIWGTPYSAIILACRDHERKVLEVEIIEIR